jgi:hypothetical protein
MCLVASFTLVLSFSDFNGLSSALYLDNIHAKVISLLVALLFGGMIPFANSVNSMCIEEPENGEVSA